MFIKYDFYTNTILIYIAMYSVFIVDFLAK